MTKNVKHLQKVTRMNVILSVNLPVKHERLLIRVVRKEPEHQRHKHSLRVKILMSNVESKTME